MIVQVVIFVSIAKDSLIRYIVNGDCLSRNAVRLLGYRPMKIRNGNGAFVVVRAGESPVHANNKTFCNGEGGQLIILVQSMENV